MKLLVIILIWTNKKLANLSIKIRKYNQKRNGVK